MKIIKTWKNHILSLIIVFLINSLSYAQESSFKVYANAFFFSEQETRQFDIPESDFYYNGLSFLYRQINANSRFHQFELKFNYRNKNQVGDTFKTLNTHFRYEYGKHPKWKIFKRIDIGLSGAAKVFFLKEEINSLAYNEYLVKNTEGGINLALFTNFEYDIGKRFYIELSVSVIGATVGLDFRKVNDPNLTTRQQKQGGFDFDMLNERILRLGIGYVFKRQNKTEIDPLK